jgi:hypothetical protein
MAARDGVTRLSGASWPGEFGCDFGDTVEELGLRIAAEWLGFGDHHQIARSS